MAEPLDPFRYTGEKLLEPAGPTMWPLAIIYFNTVSKSLAYTMAPAGAELIHGHGWQIGTFLQQAAREMIEEARAKERKRAYRRPENDVSLRATESDPSGAASEVSTQVSEEPPGSSDSSSGSS